MKPNWDDAPDWAKWLAMDSCGTWYWHQNKPVLRQGPHEGGRDYWEPKRCSEIAMEPEVPNWQNTLERRP